jgi:hypothetical protein
LKTHQCLLGFRDGFAVRRLRLQVVENVKVGSALVGAHEPLSSILQRATRKIIGQAPEGGSRLSCLLLAHNRDDRNKLTVRFFSAAKFQALFFAAVKLSPKAPPRARDAMTASARGWTAAARQAKIQPTSCRS